MIKLPIPELVSHTRAVQSLYKRSVRNVEAWIDRREVIRFYVVVLRERFEKNREVRDIRVAKDLLAEGEKELADDLHWHVRAFTDSVGGTAYQREVQAPDWVLDYWHPLEKARYPEYFARREQRKIEYTKMWMEKWAKKEKLGSEQGHKKDEADRDGGGDDHDDHPCRTYRRCRVE